MHIEDVMNDEFIDKQVTLRGWVYRQRASKNVAFVVLRDRTGIIQTVTDSSNPEFKKASEVTIESSVKITGKIRKEPRAPGGYELLVDKIDIIGLAEPFPITKDKSVSFLLDVRHLWIRSRFMTQILKIRSTVFEAAREYFANKGFIEVHPPMFITAACEGGATLFKIDYFGKKAYLTQSAQFYLEALITSLEKVYCIAPSFRAEKSRTTRHLTEFWHIEAEEAFSHLDDTMKTQEGLIEHICHRVAEKHAKELKELGRDPEYFLNIKTPFPRISYDKAIDMLQSDGFDIEWGDDFGAEVERQLTTHFDTPFFVYNYATSAKAFYHRPDPKDPRHVLCADMLAPEGHGEIIGGGERIYELDVLLKKIEEEGQDPKDYEWYIDLRRYGTQPHAGFGLGAARLIKWICGLEHIRDAVAFPRTINRVYP